MYCQCKSPVLCNIQTKMIRVAPSQPFFHNLGMMNLDESGIWSGCVFIHGCLRNEKLHTPSITVRRTVAKHTTC